MLNLRQSWGNESDWSSYQVNVPKLICWHHHHFWSPSLFLPCQVPVSPADCRAQHWISEGPESPGVSCLGVCVWERSISVTLCHKDPNAAYAISFKNVVRWALCTYSSHIVTLNECLVFMRKVLATLFPPWSYTLIPAPRCINSIHAHSEMTINTHTQDR